MQKLCFFDKNNFIRTEVHFYLKFKNKLRKTVAKNWQKYKNSQLNSKFTGSDKKKCSINRKEEKKLHFCSVNTWVPSINAIKTLSFL